MSLIASIHVVQGVHEGKRRKNVEARGSSTPKAHCSEEIEWGNLASARLVPTKTYDNVNSTKGHAVDIFGAGVKVRDNKISSGRKTKLQPTPHRKFDEK